jgi:hypothetical protein
LVLLPSRACIPPRIESLAILDRNDDREQEILDMGDHISERPCTLQAAFP